MGTRGTMLNFVAISTHCISLKAFPLIAALYAPLALKANGPHLRSEIIVCSALIFVHDLKIYPFVLGILHNNLHRYKQTNSQSYASEPKALSTHAHTRKHTHTHTIVKIDNN